ncbi:MAG: glutathione S-transferase family protein [Myxococcales bacterium]|nr:glutathione S-transferase family protein [Myxococcales bacterium]
MKKVLGVPFSAHTRKVIVGLVAKGLAYKLEPIVPLRPDLPAEFVEASPLRKVPVLIDGGVSIADSTVIALYLDRVHSERPLYPVDPAAYAKALFVEELVDGALAEHVLHGLLFQRVFRPAFLKQPTDDALVASSLRDKIPPRFADLEKLLVGEWFAGASFSQADITVASILLNFHYAGEALDAGRFPKLSEFLTRALAARPFVEALGREAPAARELGLLDLSLLARLGY